MPSRLCLCVTCGLPASGKTNLCELIQELSTMQCTFRGKSIAVVHICYDDIIPQIIFSSELQNQSSWKEYRTKIVECLDCVLGELTDSEGSLGQLASELQSGHVVSSETESTDQQRIQIRDCVWSQVVRCLSSAAGQRNNDGILFLIDDNMFYTSMRHEYFQLARKYTAGFCQVGLVCGVKTVMERNARRTEEIPVETMTTMAAKMEFPDASKHPWEKNSILIDAHLPPDHAALAPIWMLVQAAFDSPIPPLQEEDLQAKEDSRSECAASVLHQSDQTLRKAIADMMAEAKGKLDGQGLRDLAMQLRNIKTAILEGVRGGRLIPPPFPREGESGDVFDAFFKDCLSSKVER